MGKLKGVAPLHPDVSEFPKDSDRPDSPGPPDPDAEIDDTPTVSCTRCGREWDLSHELDELEVGNRAVEQFALDHMQHTGHYPDGVATWRAVCRNCPEGVERLSEHGASRWAETHARHTRHDVEVHPASEGDDVTVVEG